MTTPKERRDYLTALVHDLDEAQRHLSAAGMRCMGRGPVLAELRVARDMIEQAKKRVEEKNER